MQRWRELLGPHYDAFFYLDSNGVVATNENFKKVMHLLVWDSILTR